MMTGDQISDSAILSRLNKSAQILVDHASARHELENQISEFLAVAQMSQMNLNFLLNSNIEIFGKLRDKKGSPTYLAWQGPTELKRDHFVIEGQGREHHAAGFGLPLGKVETLKEFFR